MQQIFLFMGLKVCFGSIRSCVKGIMCDFAVLIAQSHVVRQDIEVGRLRPAKHDEHE